MPAWLAKTTNSNRCDMGVEVIQGIPLCYPCLRTCVTHVPGLYSPQRARLKLRNERVGDDAFHLETFVAERAMINSGR